MAHLHIASLHRNHLVKFDVPAIKLPRTITPFMGDDWREVLYI